MMPDLAYRLLTDSELADGLSQLPGWSVVKGQLTRQWSFASYKEGLVFASAAGWQADALDHHPDLLIGYAKVTVSMHTHDVGGLSPYDLELARRLQALAP